MPGRVLCQVEFEFPAEEDELGAIEVDAEVILSPLAGLTLKRRRSRLYFSGLVYIIET